MKRILCSILAFALLLSLSACSNGAAEDISKELAIKAKSTEEMAEELDKIELTDDEKIAVTNFSINILKNAVSSNGDKNQNTLISGLSIMPCLAMVQNGASGNTLGEMENTLGLNKDILNKYLYQYRTELEKDEEQKLFMANSIWFKDDQKLEIMPDFLQTNTDFYNAEIFKASFDESTLNQINKWVDKNTNGMIKEIIKKIPPQAVMYLVNAIYFQDTWQDEYDESDIEEAVFFTEDDKVEDVELMYSTEDIYLEDENCIGVMKPYKDNRYSFIALLPNLNTKMSDFLETLSYQKLESMIANYYASSNSFFVRTYIPKFKSEYTILLNETLQNMGMNDAFDINKADFSKLGKSANGNIFISNVIHKTYIEVDETGTKAAAVTAVVCEDGCALIEDVPQEKTVRLDRPFVYMIYDNYNGIPIFIGTVMSAK